ncbi:MAG: hypothetical protein HeimC2_16560 [Candidatus Heimdallarchaeota archaeon LC_2]|nr:MAG: hypothetical protein HeimC2_16560 [Candidatus Heimdallarchaeota archaeon LC_2]
MNLVTAACGCQSCVNRREEQFIEIYKGKKMIFCNNECIVEFKTDPEKFLKSDHFKIKFSDLENA